MAITINGSGTITGVSAGGLPDGSVTADDLASTLDLGSKTLTIPTNTTGLPSGGLSDAQLWRLAVDRSHNSGEIIGINSGEWESYDDGNYGSLGSSMSVSTTSSESTGGQFTFPSTGIWYVLFNGNARIQDSNGYFGVQIESTYDNGSNWDDASQKIESNSYQGYYHNITAQFIFNCTNTSTHRIRFKALESGGYVKYEGDTNIGLTTALFMKLGET